MNFPNRMGIAMLFLFASQAGAETALTVTGTDTDGSEKTVQYSIDDLKALDQTSYDTINDFVEARTQFSGPLMRDLLSLFPVTEYTILKLTALNDYEIEIPLTDATNYDVIVALEKNGAPMSIRDNGPLWVIYPMSDHPELQAEIYHLRLIWQLTDIEVE